jgi:hypothetical protein
MSDEQNLIKEVDEEVRQDNYKRIWNKYKKYIFISIIILLTLVIAINVYKFNKEKKIEKQSELFFQAIQYIEEEDYQNAKEILKEINNSKTTGYSDLSFLYILDLVNKQEISLDLNDIKIKKNSIFFELIILQKFNNQINSNIDNIDNIDEIVNLSKPSSNWKYLAHELLSSYYLKKNDKDNALQSLYVIINSDDSGELVRERAKTLVEMIKKNK